MIRWWSDPAYAASESGRALGSLDGVFALGGECVSRDSLSRVLVTSAAGRRLYVKRYHDNGGFWRNWLATPRVRREWRNLERFSAWGIPVPAVVARGEQRRFFRFVRGAIVTEAVEGAVDLATLAQRHDPRLRDRRWVAAVSCQLADITRRLHSHQFAHNDLKWRNVLVTGDAESRVYLIDCPSGRFWPRPFLGHRVVKDLACLDKSAARVLSRTQRLRFYLSYCGRSRLEAADKRNIRHILAFFQGGA